MMGEGCSLPQDVSTPELQTNHEHDVSPHPFATWVRDALDALEVATTSGNHLIRQRPAGNDCMTRKR